MKRLADPYRHLDVIDSRAPRFNQATIGVLAAVAVATGCGGSSGSSRHSSSLGSFLVGRPFVSCPLASVEPRRSTR